ncbi:kinase-like domain-containing protein [Flagelloscypha sp. PMI_526]|nr:kinase-like domain-containing protein [Flagelloscypha sp. PMI_526]
MDNSPFPSNIGGGSCLRAVADWTEGDVTEWLSSLGLGCYALSFQENKIRGDNLLDESNPITQSDLRDLGVTALGDRKRILNAISSLPRRQTTGNPLPLAPVTRVTNLTISRPETNCQPRKSRINPDLQAFEPNAELLLQAMRDSDSGYVALAKSLCCVIRKMGSARAKDYLTRLNKLIREHGRIEWISFDPGKVPDAMAVINTRESEAHVISLTNEWTLRAGSASELRAHLLNRTFSSTWVPNHKSAVSSKLFLLDFVLHSGYWAPGTERWISNKMRDLMLFHKVIPPTIEISGIKSLEWIASGGYSDIYKGIWNVPMQKTRLVVLKRLHLNKFHSSEEDKQSSLWGVLKEAAIWHTVRHPNILPFLGVNYDSFPGAVCLVSPFIPKGCIAQYIASHPHGLTRPQLYYVLLKVATALNYLHSVGICHGDIKGANILLDNRWEPLLADMGIATAVAMQTQSLALQKTETETMKGSLQWLAPEVLLPTFFSPSDIFGTRDIYAFGCTMLEILTGSPPWPNRTDYEVILAIHKKERPSRPTDFLIPEDIWLIIQDCWHHEPTERPTAVELLRRIQAVVAVEQEVHSHGAMTPSQLHKVIRPRGRGGGRVIAHKIDRARLARITPRDLKMIMGDGPFPHPSSWDSLIRMPENHPSLSTIDGPSGSFPSASEALSEAIRSPSSTTALARLGMSLIGSISSGLIFLSSNNDTPPLLPENLAVLSKNGTFILTFSSDASETHSVGMRRPGVWSTYALDILEDLCHETLVQANIGASDINPLKLAPSSQLQRFYSWDVTKNSRKLSLEDVFDEFNWACMVLQDTSLLERVSIFRPVPNKAIAHFTTNEGHPQDEIRLSLRLKACSVIVHKPHPLQKRSFTDSTLAFLESDDGNGTNNEDVPELN